MLRRNMRREMITEEELMGQAREQGIDDISKVKKTYMERDGRVSIIAQEQKQHDKPERNAVER